MITQCKYDGAQMENEEHYRYGFMGGGKEEEDFSLFIRIMNR